MARGSTAAPLNAGEFCWAGLATTDVPGALQFYGELFGWTAIALPGGETWLFTHHGGTVAMVYPLAEAARRAGMPSHWSGFVSVASLGRAAIRARRLGGQLSGPPFPLGDDCWTAPVSDRLGGMVTLWRSSTHPRADRLTGVGAWNEAELAVSAVKTAERFYTQLFGWAARHRDSHTQITGCGPVTARIRCTPHEPDPTGWILTFNAASVSAITSILQHKDRLLRPTVETVGPGSLIMSDPQGAILRVTGADMQAPAA
jgi:uncharacterized protein